MPNPVGGIGEAEDTERVRRSSRELSRDRSTLLEPCPEPLDDVAVAVGPGQACDWGFVAIGGDHRGRTFLPLVLAEGMAGFALVYPRRGASGKWSSSGMA